jgi:hypothetical protein
LRLAAQQRADPAALSIPLVKRLDFDRRCVAVSVAEPSRESLGPPQGMKPQNPCEPFRLNTLDMD